MKTRAMMPVLKLMMTVALKTTKTVITIMSCHVVTFKCIGRTKSRDYQSALKKARDMLRIIKTKTIIMCPSLWCLNQPIHVIPKHWLLFVWLMANNTQLSELLDEVHAARNVGSNVSVKFSWIRYVTQWSRSGPAGIDIEKNGMWSTNVVSRQSTK